MCFRFHVQEGFQQSNCRIFLMNNVWPCLIYSPPCMDIVMPFVLGRPLRCYQKNVNKVHYNFLIYILQSFSLCRIYLLTHQLLLTRPDLHYTHIPTDATHKITCMSYASCSVGVVWMTNIKSIDPTYDGVKFYAKGILIRYCHGQTLKTKPTTLKFLKCTC